MLWNIIDGNIYNRNIRDGTIFFNNRFNKICFKLLRFKYRNKIKYYALKKFLFAIFIQYVALIMSNIGKKEKKIFI